MKTGLFFGSFNPVHIGHLVIAEFMATRTDLDEVWIVVSPQNPLKQKKSLANNFDRLHLVQVAVEDNPRLQVSDIEFKLPIPSYTIDTLTYLREKHPSRQFALIMGGDNLCSLPKWKNYEILLRDYPIYVYNRPNYGDCPLKTHPAIRFFDAPLMDISATFIRKSIKNNQSIRYLVPDKVNDEILNSNMYR